MRGCFPEHDTIVEIFFVATFDFVFFYILCSFFFYSLFFTVMYLLVLYYVFSSFYYFVLLAAVFVISFILLYYLAVDFLYFSTCISPPHALTYPIYAKLIQTKTVVFYSLFRSFKYLTIFC